MKWMGRSGGQLWVMDIQQIAKRRCRGAELVLPPPQGFPLGSQVTPLTKSASSRIKKEPVEACRSPLCTCARVKTLAGKE